MSYKTYASAAALVAGSLLGGCKTAEMTEYDAHKIPSGQSQEIRDLLTRINSRPNLVSISPAKRTNSLTFGQSVELAEKYSGLLEKQRVTVYWPEEQNGKQIFVSHSIDTALLNNDTDKLKTLEGLISGDNAIELTLAPASKNTVFPFTSRNQIYNGEINQITSHSDGSPNFALGLYVETSPTKNLNAESRGTIKIQFGMPEQESKMSADKTRDDWKADLPPVAIASGIGYIIAREPGAIIPPVIYAVDGVTGFIGSQVRPVPDGTIFTEGSSFMAESGTDLSALRVASTLNSAKRLGVDNLVVFPYNHAGVRGTGIVALDQVDSVKSDGNTLFVETSHMDTGYLGRALYGILKGAAVAGIIEGFCDHDSSEPSRPSESQGQNLNQPGQNLPTPSSGGGIIGSPGGGPAVPQGGGTIGGSPAAGGGIGGSPGASP